MSHVQRDDAELGGTIMVPIGEGEEQAAAAEPQLGEGEPGQRAEEHGAER